MSLVSLFIFNLHFDECRITFDVRGRRSGEAAKGTRKRSLWAVPLDGMVRCDRFSEHLP